MDKTIFEAADPITDEIAEATTELLESEATQKLRGLLAKLNKVIGTQYAVSLVLNVEVFDDEKKRNLPLLQTGMSGFDASPTRPGLTPRRNATSSVGKCWWLPMTVARSAGKSGISSSCINLATIAMRHWERDVKLLLDTDVCPWCEEGKVSMSQPTCSKCGHTVDPETWFGADFAFRFCDTQLDGFSVAS